MGYRGPIEPYERILLRLEDLLLLIQKIRLLWDDPSLDLEQLQMVNGYYLDPDYMELDKFLDEINEPLLRSGRMWMQVGPKIHGLKFGTLEC